MGYKIRYGPPRWREKPGWYSIRFQVMTAVLLLALVLVLRGWKTGADVMARWLLPGEPSGAEQAVWAMAQSIAAGEGWYSGAVAFGRCILEMAGV